MVATKSVTWFPRADGCVKDLLNREVEAVLPREFFFRRAQPLAPPYRIAVNVSFSVSDQVSLT